MKNNHFVYIASYYDDEYELPIAVADTIEELAVQIGAPLRSVKRYLNDEHYNIGNYTYKIEKIQMSSEAEDIRDLKTPEVEVSTYAV